MMLDFGEAVRRFYKNYFNPDGRAQRSAYWWVVVFQLIIYVVLTIVIFMAEGGDQLRDAINAMLDGEFDAASMEEFYLGPSGVIAALILMCFALANILPDIMLSIRRFHDLNQTGWLVLVFKVLGALPGIGLLASIGNLLWFALPGTTGPNRYGPDPLRGG
jgi:uncharacterized membrane protein YhaH (DUF805 family)